MESMYFKIIIKVIKILGLLGQNKLRIFTMTIYNFKQLNNNYYKYMEFKKNLYLFIYTDKGM